MTGKWASVFQFLLRWKAGKTFLPHLSEYLKKNFLDDVLAALAASTLLHKSNTWLGPWPSKCLDFVIHTPRCQLVSLWVCQLAIGLAWPKTHDDHLNKGSLHARHNFYCCIHLRAHTNTHTHTHAHTRTPTSCSYLFDTHICQQFVRPTNKFIGVSCLCLTNISYPRRTITSRPTRPVPAPFACSSTSSTCQCQRIGIFWIFYRTCNISSWWTQQLTINNLAKRWTHYKPNDTRSICW